MEDKSMIKYGVDELTISINKNDRKTEDWHSDFNGKLVINGEIFYANVYQKNENWIAGKLVKADPNKVSENKTMINSTELNDEIPF
ncbi:MAG: hypothetical protein O2871_01780 [bacterium]|nr:hypothetical protein [bacterium]